MIFTYCESTDCALVGVSAQWNPIWSLVATPLVATPECRLTIITLLRLLASSKFMAAMKIEDLSKQQEQNHSILLLLWLQFLVKYRICCRNSVLWSVCVRIAWIFPVLILMWCHFRSPSPILRYRKLSQMQFQTATEERMDFGLKSSKRKKCLFLLLNPS